MDYTKANLSEAIREIERASSEAKRDFGQLSVEELNWKPAPDRWSLGECLEHLITANSQYFGIVEALLAGRYRKPFMAHVPGYPGMLGRLLINAVSPQAERKVKTAPVFEPSSSTVPANEVARFVENNKELVAVIRRSERLNLDKTMIASPVSSLVVYSLLDAWRLIAAHEMRHLGQARTVVAMDGFGA